VSATPPSTPGRRVAPGLLHRGRLAPGRAWAASTGGVVLTAVAFRLTPLQGRADFVVVAYLAGAAAYLAAAAGVEGPRSVVDRLAAVAMATTVGICLLALGSVLVYTAARGVKDLSWDFFTHSMHGVGPRDHAGGAYHSILGTLEQVLIASALSVPSGLLVAVYLTEYGHGRLAGLVRAVVDLMVGIPSIVAGLFVLSSWILLLGFGYSGFAGSMALAILMMPIVVRSTEEMLRLVPNGLREASLALGVPRWRTILKVVVPTALGGITTGVMLAVARIAGETAPILLLVFGAASINPNPFEGAQSSLPYYVYEQWKLGNQASYDRAWGAALVLIVFVMILNVAARALARRQAPKTGH
jgi:phosphate transport system permease protein